MKAISPEQSQADYLSPAEAAHATGLSVRQLSRLADEGTLRAIRPGTHRRYLAADIAALIAAEPWAPAS
ncbi:helix-turn-helix domain-containing protein [Microbacterium sp.]|uniref:helix-turn-helix domain-containing protein n=1 Tax=Microbacterium sp. TaxID=51671 RepID=UPI003A8D4A80